MAVAPPRPKSIALTALRAFEAAARLGGFSAAAEELGVNPGAISAHIKALEAELGAPLFQRSPKGVVLTALGAQALPGFRQAFDQMGLAVQQLRDAAAPRVVHIATLPAIAQFWLSPRLPQLRAEMPGTEISITALEQPPNLKRTPYDLCLFYDADQGEILSRDVIFPVCNPAVAAELHGPQDLSRIACLSDTSWQQDWHDWLSGSAAPQNITPRGPVYSLYALAVEEALNGAGVLIGHEALLASHLQSGRLVAPFSQRVTLPRALRLWTMPGRGAASASRQVAEWLMTSGGQDLPDAPKPPKGGQ
ncbi:LysR family transcriptional regulator [Pseudophaeobacter sp.]|uniref:LysR family transcriptional regulator n=1 Tax=Pseudophaeobacter sp. TaxID=1971739 RepID=UPI004059193B